MSNLFSDDEGDGDGATMLTINEHYAKAFEYRKEREELEKLKAKYGSDYDPDDSGSDFSTDSESAESEDEHGEELTPAVDAAILRTLAKIRKKDPEIYDSSKSIFGQERERLAAKAPKISNGQTKSKSNSKPLTIRQVNLDAMLNPSRSPSPSADEHQPLTHVQEQEALRRETIAAFHGAVANTGDDDFLIPREKTKDEREAEEEEYRAFLEREVGDLKELVIVDDERKQENENEEGGGDEGEEEGGAEGSDKKKKKKKKKSKKAAAEEDSQKPPTKLKAEQDQEFLMNYILNRGWIDHSKGHVPTYNEVTEPVPERRKKKKGKSKVDDSAPNEGFAASDNSNNEDEDDPGLLTDSSFESIASIFEASYNHRFEEPGASTIPSFPRTLPSLVRREDTTRKDARERRKARKAEEVQKKREEVKRLKALKMREVKRKLEMIGKQGGLKRTVGAGGADEGEGEDGFVDEALRELDLEGEWDPEKHDRQMAGLFERGAEAFEDEGEAQFDDYDDAAQYDEDGKPVWDDDIDIGDIPMSDDDGDVVYAPPPESSKKEKKKKKKKKKNGDEEDDDQGVDIDAMDADVERPYDEDEEWDGTEEMRKRKLNEYMDEIYGLNFNDLVGGMPTRFKYVPVQKQTFALTPAEILLATDQELNEYMSVKKYAPYRLDKQDRSRWNKSTQEKLHGLKAKVGERSGGVFGVGRSGARGRAGEGEGEGGEEKVKKRKGRKERMKAKAAVSAVGGGDDDGDSDDEGLQHDEKPTKSIPVPRSGEKRKRGDVDEQAERVIAAALPGEKNVNGDAGDAGTAKKKRKRRHHKKGDADADAAQA